MALINCPGCGKEVSSNAAACPHCGEPIDTSIKCPKCGSKNVVPISNAKKVGSMIMWGMLAANKVMSKHHCNDCKHDF